MKSRLPVIILFQGKGKKAPKTRFLLNDYGKILGCLGFYREQPKGSMNFDLNRKKQQNNDNKAPEQQKSPNLVPVKRVRYIRWSNMQLSPPKISIHPEEVHFRRKPIF